MATRLYGLSRGERYVDIAEDVGSAVAADSIELTIDLAANLTKMDILTALDMFKEYITHRQFPPA